MSPGSAAIDGMGYEELRDLLARLAIRISYDHHEDALMLLQLCRRIRPLVEFPKFPIQRSKGTPS